MTIEETLTTIINQINKQSEAMQIYEKALINIREDYIQEIKKITEGIISNAKTIDNAVKIINQQNITILAKVEILQEEIIAIKKQLPNS